MKETDRETIRVAKDIEAIRGLVNQAFDVERFLKKGGGEGRRPAGLGTIRLSHSRSYR